MSSRVSVIIPTCDRPRLLRRAIQSVLGQSYRDIEVVVIDDSRSESAAWVTRDFRDSRVKYFRNCLTKGACGSRNTGIRVATGKFYTGLDDDDYFHPERIERLASAYHPRYSFVSSNMLEIWDNRRVLRFRRELEVERKDILWCNCVGNQIFTEMRKIEEVRGFNESLICHQDWDLWIRMIERWGKGLRLASCLYYLDMAHGGSRISYSDEKPIGMQEFFRVHGEKFTCAQRMIASMNVRKWSNRPHLARGVAALMLFGGWEYIVKKKLRIW